jgi:TctA family transporter
MIGGLASRRLSRGKLIRRLCRYLLSLYLSIVGFGQVVGDLRSSINVLQISLRSCQLALGLNRSAVTLRAKSGLSQSDLVIQSILL